MPKSSTPPPTRRRASDVTRRLGEVLREARESLELSQEQLAERARVHRTYVGGVERGERNISIVALEAMVSALGMDWREFGRRLDLVPKQDRGPTRTRGTKSAKGTKRRA